MPPESWIEKAIEHFGAKPVFWGITIATLLAFISLIIGIVLGITKICHLLKKKEDHVSPQTINALAKLATEQNGERKQLADELKKTKEEKETLEQDIKTAKDQLTRQTVTSEEEKRQAVSQILKLLEHIQKDYAKLTDNYLEVCNLHNIETQRSLVEKILVLSEREFNYAIVKRIGEISEHVKKMSESELKHQIEEFIRITDEIKKDPEKESLSKKNLAVLLADAKRKPSNNHSDNKSLAQILAEAKQKNIHPNGE